MSTAATYSDAGLAPPVPAVSECPGLKLWAAAADGSGGLDLDANGLDLDEAASMTMNYLCAIGGVALLVGFAYLLVRPLATSPAGWWPSASLTTLGIAVAVHN